MIMKCEPVLIVPEVLTSSWIYRSPLVIPLHALDLTRARVVPRSVFVREHPVTALGEVIPESLTA